jgi:hypothetical protein
MLITGIKYVGEISHSGKLSFDKHAYPVAGFFCTRQVVGDERIRAAIHATAASLMAGRSP